MDGCMLTQIPASVYNHLLWRSVVFASLIGLAFTQTTAPSIATRNEVSQFYQQTKQVTVSPLLTATSETTSKSSTRTPQITFIVTTNVTLSTNQTTSVAPSTLIPTEAVTEPLSTVPVTVTTSSSPGSTPEQTPVQQTTRSKETTAPLKSLPSTRPGPALIATSKGTDIVTPTGGSTPQGSTNNVALYLLLPLVILAGLAMVIMIGSYLRKKIRLDKLRHQLLPLYSFDPQEGEDWETELLTEPRANSQTPLNTTKPLVTTTVIAEIPKLRFSPDTVDV